MCMMEWDMCAHVHGAGTCMFCGTHVVFMEPEYGCVLYGTHVVMFLELMFMHASMGHVCHAGT